MDFERVWYPETVYSQVGHPIQLVDPCRHVDSLLQGSVVMEACSEGLGTVLRHTLQQPVGHWGIACTSHTHTHTPHTHKPVKCFLLPALLSAVHATRGQTQWACACRHCAVRRYGYRYNKVAYIGVTNYKRTSHQAASAVVVVVHYVAAHAPYAFQGPATTHPHYPCPCHSVHQQQHPLPSPPRPAQRPRRARAAAALPPARTAAAAARDRLCPLCALIRD